MSRRDFEDIHRLFPLDEPIWFRPEHTARLAQDTVDVEGLDFVKLWTPVAGPSTVVLLLQLRPRVWLSDNGCRIDWPELAHLIGASGTSPAVTKRVAETLGRACRYQLASIGVDETSGTPVPYVRVDYEVGVPRSQEAAHV